MSLDEWEIVNSTESSKCQQRNIIINLLLMVFHFIVADFQYDTCITSGLEPFNTLVITYLNVGEYFTMCKMARYAYASVNYQ